MTEVRDNSHAEWEEKIVKEVEERRAKRSKTRSQDLDRILLLKRRQLDEDVNLACAGHQARYDSDVSKHLQKLKLEAYKAKESTPDLKARIDQETTLLHQQVPRAQEMMDLMDHLRAQVGLPKAEFEAPQSHDLLGLQEAEQARDAEQARASTDQARPSTDQGRASTDQAQGTTPQDTTMEPPPNPREPAQDGDGQGDGQGHGGHGQGEGWYSRGRQGSYQHYTHHQYGPWSNYNAGPASGTNQAQGNEPGRQLGRIPAWLPPWIQSTGQQTHPKP